MGRASAASFLPHRTARERFTVSDSSTARAGAASTGSPLIFTPEYYERMRALEAGAWWNAGMRDVARALLDDATLPTTGMLVDVGCGSGQTMAWALEFLPHWDAIGIDVAPEGVAAARAAGLHALEASALDLPLPDNSADLVITLDMLQHLPLAGGDQAAMNEMHRVLRPGGHLLVRTNAQTFPRMADDPRAHFHAYEVGELRAKLERAGFTVLRVGSVNALLGLAEIPRRLRARRAVGDGYQGLLAPAPESQGPSAVNTSQPTPDDRDGVAPLAARSAALKRAWLRLEGQALRFGISLPLGRTILALCRA